MIPLEALLIRAAVQVTLFSLALAAIYFAARRVGSRAAVGALLWGMSLVLGLTLLAGSPWPQWRFDSFAQAEALPVAATSASAESDTATIAASREAGVAPISPNEFTLSDYASAFAAALTEPTVRPETPRTSWRAWLLGAIALGVLLSVARLVWGLVEVRRLRSGSRAIEDSALHERFRAVQHQVGLRTAVQLRESSATATPATIGWRRAVILLPAAWRDWSDQQLYAVLAHEAAHVVSRDYLGWVVARLAVAAHFYNPLVRWLAGRLQLEQELAADAAAARAVGDPQRYLHALAELALATPTERAVGPARTLFPTRSLLMRRVEMLRSPIPTVTNQTARAGLQLTGGALLVLVALSAAGLRAPVVVMAEEPVRYDVVKFHPIERLPLSLVPADAVYAIAIHPALLLADPAYDPLLAELDQSPELEDAGLSVRDVAEVMMVVRADSKARPRVVARLFTPDACIKFHRTLIERIEANGEKASIGPKVLQTPHQRITRVDDTTLMWEPHPSTSPNGEGLPPTHTHLLHKWADEWTQREGQPLVAAISVESLRNKISPEERKKLLGGFPMQALAPAFDHTGWAVASVGLGEQLTLDAVAECDSPQNAEQVATIAQVLITLASGVVQQQQAASGSWMEQLSLAEREKVKPLVEQMDSIAIDFLNNAKPVADGNRVHLQHSTRELRAADAAQVVQFMLPAVKASRHAARRNRSTYDLKQLALALLNYESAYGKLPAAKNYHYKDSATGEKKESQHPHSWRVAVLPFLEQQALYNQYRFDEPWDSEANQKIAQTVVPTFQSPFDDPSSTSSSYFVLTGPDTVFSGKEGTKYREITDGTSQTLLIVEAKRDIPWTKPEDIPYAADKPLPELGGWTPGVFLTAWCDGHALAVDQDVAEADLRGAITRSGREIFDFNKWNRNSPKREP